MAKTALYGTGAWKKLRLSVLSRDGYICAYCGLDATTVDHVVAVARGGDMFDRENLVACCSRCNSAKGARSDAFFLSETSTPIVPKAILSPATTATTPTNPVVTINDPDQN
jgi:hypothetical protein